MLFAAKEAVERKARERGRREGIQEGIRAGRQTERERINAALEQQGVELTPELVKLLSGDDE
jgi:predicted transposase YdaD